MYTCDTRREKKLRWPGWWNNETWNDETMKLLMIFCPRLKTVRSENELFGQLHRLYRLDVLVKQCALLFFFKRISVVSSNDCHHISNVTLRRNFQISFWGPFLKIENCWHHAGAAAPINYQSATPPSPECPTTPRSWSSSTRFFSFFASVGIFTLENYPQTHPTKKPSPSILWLLLRAKKKKSN